MGMAMDLGIGMGMVMGMGMGMGLDLVIRTEEKTLSTLATSYPLTEEVNKMTSNYVSPSYFGNSFLLNRWRELFKYGCGVQDIYCQVLLHQGTPTLYKFGKSDGNGYGDGWGGYECRAKDEDTAVYFSSIELLYPHYIIPWRCVINKLYGNH